MSPRALDETMDAIKDRRNITSLVRGLEVLSCFESGEEFLGNLQIADRCALPRSTVARLTFTLVQAGYLYQEKKSGRYRLGASALAIGGVSLTRLKIRDRSRAVLQQLAESVGLQIALGVRDDLSMLYVETCNSTSIVRLRLDIGSKVPLATTAIGRACIAVMPPPEREALFMRMKKVLYQSNWGEVEAAIVREMQSVQERGCACSFGEWRPEISGIAVPLVLGGGMPNFAISAAGVAGLRSVNYYLDVVLPQLLSAVRSIRNEWD